MLVMTCPLAASEYPKLGTSLPLVWNHLESLQQLLIHVDPSLILSGPIPNIFSFSNYVAITNAISLDFIASGDQLAEPKQDAPTEKRGQ